MRQYNLLGKEQIGLEATKAFRPLPEKSGFVEKRQTEEHLIYLLYQGCVLNPTDLQKIAKMTDEQEMVHLDALFFLEYEIPYLEKDEVSYLNYQKIIQQRRLQRGPLTFEACPENVRETGKALLTLYRQTLLTDGQAELLAGAPVHVKVSGLRLAIQNCLKDHSNENYLAFKNNLEMIDQMKKMLGRELPVDKKKRLA